jgi:hypothetical protein
MKDQVHLRPNISLHTIILSMEYSAAVENHGAMAKMAFYRHEVHEPAHPNEPDWFKILSKYNLMWSLLMEARDGDILIFAEDCLAFIATANLALLADSEDVWVCQDGHNRDRGNGSLIILKRGAAAFAWVSAVVDNLKEAAANVARFSRWDRSELVGHYTANHDTMINGMFPNLLFPSYGYAFPNFLATATTFNPLVLPEHQDARTNELVVRHLTQCLTKIALPFNFPQVEALPDTDLLAGRRSRVALIILITSSDAAIYAPTINNAQQYCNANGYALFIKHVDRLRDDGANDMLLHIMEQAKLYEYVLCLREDTLFNRLSFKIPPLFQEVSLVFGQSSLTSPNEIGCLGVRLDGRGRELLDAIQNLQVSRPQDSPAPVDELLALPGVAEAGHVLDMSIFAPFPSVRNSRTGMVRYVDLPQNVRRLAMIEDHVLAEPAIRERKPLKTSLSIFRHKSLNIIITVIMALVAITTVVKSL